jgi:hypothetical protein
VASPFPSNLDWPTNYGASRLTGKFMDLQGQPIRGRLVITANVISVADAGNLLTIIATPRTVLLDNNGAFDIFLPATNDPDVNPSGWNYKVTEQWDGGGGRTYNIDAPEGATQDLSVVAPVPAATGTPITRGLSAYEVAVKNGYVGTEVAWLASLQGTGGTGTGTGLTNGSVLDVHVAANAAIALSKTADSATRVAMTSTERTKLTGIATGATANATDAQLRDRSLHTGQQLSGTISDFTEAAQDATAALLVAGTGVTLTYNDAANTLTINSTATGGGGAFTSATDPVFIEGVQDVIGSSVVAGNGISVIYNDTANTFTVSASANGTIVLGANDPVPAGTPAGTIIYRTA